MALSLDGSVYIWGKTIMGEVLTPQNITSTIPNKVVDIELGRTMSAAIDLSGMVWVWGENKKGELGVRDQCPRENPYPLASVKGKPVKSLAIGH